jgi:ribonucleoside-diphosphate reductase alpha chain
MTHYNKTARFNKDEYNEVFDSIYNLEVMPSMRALMSSGPALDRCNVAGYNCSYLPVDSPRSFDEAMYILMCGTGVGYSVERKYTEKLPKVAEAFHQCQTVIEVPDSKIGWAKSFRQLIALLYNGDIPKWDMNKIRPAGARLKTFGGRASGPEPLDRLFKFSVSMFKNAAGRRLSTIECHDLMCMVADIVVVGGVRRSAMISLSDVDDPHMQVAKSPIHIDNYHLISIDDEENTKKYSIQFIDPGYGLKNLIVELSQYDSENLEKNNQLGWWVLHGHRRLANNSAVYEGDRPTTGLFMKEWCSLYNSHSGERGMFSRTACQNIAKRNGRRDFEQEFGTNPCSEIILRPYGFCNLTEIVVRADDTIEALKKKARVATILGTIQSSFTDFKYLRKIWKDNADEERLLGVSLTGVCDNRFLVGAEELLSEVRDYVVEVNKEWAKRLKINQSAATTCIKPSGTVSQLVNSSSGMHTRFAPFYLRSVRGDNKDPLTDFMKSIGILNEPDLMNDQNTVFYFPIKSPLGSVTRNDLNAIDTLEMWKCLQDNWCEHKPSVTINVQEDEWMETGSWMFKNFDMVSGVSFLPYDGGTYRQAPYQEITEEEYIKYSENMPKSVDWSLLQEFEKEDTTTGNQELACTAGGCEI